MQHFLYICILLSLPPPPHAHSLFAVLSLCCGQTAAEQPSSSCCCITLHYVCIYSICCKWRWRVCVCVCVVLRSNDNINPARLLSSWLLFIMHTRPHSHRHPVCLNISTHAHALWEFHRFTFTLISISSYAKARKC